MRLALREVLLAFRRAPVLALLGITTIAFSLFAFGLFGLVAINIRSALREVENRVEIRAFLTEGASDSAASEVVVAMQRLPQVADVGYVSPDSALERARAELAEFRDVNPSVENIARVIFRLLRPRFTGGAGELASVTVWETPKTWCEYAE